MSYRLMPTTDQLPYALYRADQVRALDRMAIEQFGIPSDVLMERAGQAAFELLRQHWPQARNISVLAGSGNNGGDGFVLARRAAEAGLQVQVLQLGDGKALQGDAALNAARWREMGGQWEPYAGLPRECDVIVDGLLGTGLQREVRGSWEQAINDINAHAAPILALDIPSGLNADTGAIMGCAVKAALTISFIGLKQGMFTADGPHCCGVIVADALQVPARVYASQLLAARRIDWNKMSSLLPPRPRNAHKGHFGHVLVIGGDHGFGGAARLAAEAALRSGAGLVSLATRAAHVSAVLAGRPEIMVHAVEDVAALEPLLARATVVVVGPGLGQADWGRAMWQRVSAIRQPTVVDADALNLLALAPLKVEKRVLTPHPGEAARLLSVCNHEINNDRFAALGRLLTRYDGTVVLKGAGSLVQSPGRAQPAVCSDGNPGMASGGMGDVLSGVTGAFLAQGHDCDEAAGMAVCLHAAAADAAARESGERGLLATDLMPWLRRLLNGFT